MEKKVGKFKYNEDKTFLGLFNKGYLSSEVKFNENSGFVSEKIPEFINSKNKKVNKGSVKKTKNVDDSVSPIKRPSRKNKKLNHLYVSCHSLNEHINNESFFSTRKLLIHLIEKINSHYQDSFESFQNSKIYKNQECSNDNRSEMFFVNSPNLYYENNNNNPIFDIKSSSLNINHMNEDNEEFKISERSPTMPYYIF